jgi:hypothetical protein
VAVEGEHVAQLAQVELHAGKLSNAACEFIGAVCDTK